MKLKRLSHDQFPLPNITRRPSRTQSISSITDAVDDNLSVTEIKVFDASLSNTSGSKVDLSPIMRRYMEILRLSAEVKPSSAYRIK